MYLQDINSLLSAQELFLISTAPDDTLHLIRVLNFHMQTNLRVLGLEAIAVVAFLLGADKCMHGLYPPLPVLDHLGPLKLKLRVFHGNPTAVEANTAQCLENDIEETIVVNRTSQLNMPKVTGIRLVMEVTETRVIDTSVDWLSCQGLFFGKLIFGGGG